MSYWDTFGSMEGTVRCTDAACRASRDPQPFTVRLVVRAWAKSVAGGPGVVSRTERQPLQMPENCSTCGGPVEIADVQYTSTGPGGGRDLTVRWPVPRFDASVH